MARNEVICSILVYIAWRRNPYHRQIAENALQLSNGLFKRRKTLVLKPLESLQMIMMFGILKH